MSGVEALAGRNWEATLLIVEDEDSIRKAVAKMLRETGFEVFEAADGSSAIELLRANGGKIDVVLLDMTLPGASSPEIVAEALKARPDIRVILTSAYSQETIAGGMGAQQIRSFIRKPFQIQDLVKTLRNVLSSELTLLATRSPLKIPGTLGHAIARTRVFALGLTKRRRLFFTPECQVAQPSIL
jgi:DNA-binding NtrC family response regulator